MNKERREAGETKAQRKDRSSDRDRLRAIERGARPARPGRPTPARAEEAGFSFALISDHFHPWIERHPHSPFVWGVLGAIAQATDKLVVGTGVTCPTFRIHPAIIAHAAATAADLMPGRFFLGVGTGENLNEHILGQALAGMGGPRRDARGGRRGHPRAVDAARSTSHRGRHYTVQNARLYTLPEELPPHPRRGRR